MLNSLHSKVNQSAEYSELNMYAVYASSNKEIKYVLSNLCKPAVAELVKILGKDYKQKALAIIKTSNKKYLIKLKSSHEPVGLFGLLPQGNKTAGIFLLTTDKLHSGNIITFIRKAKQQVEEWLNEYKLIMDTCDKKNDVIKKWLLLLGFKPSKCQDEYFQIYYKGDISLAPFLN